MFKRFKSTIKEQLRQGTSPEKLTSAMSTAVVFGVFPLIGFTTLLCLGAGAIFRLNHPTMQVTNYLMGPLQLLLMPAFLRLGEFLVGATPVAFSPVTMFSHFTNSPATFLAEYGKAGALAVMAWALIMPLLGFIVYRISLPIVRKQS